MAKELSGLFGCISDVVEVVIALIRNRGGKRFGFARFSEVEDARLLAIKLDNVIIEDSKIHANIPTYERKMLLVGFSTGGKAKEMESRLGERSQGYEGCRYGVGFRGGNVQRSFSDVVANRGGEWWIGVM